GTADPATNAAPSLTQQPLLPGELRGRFIGTGDGVVELVEVQPEGKSRLAADAWLNGARPRPGERLGA
ncbi:MAG: hypothetical protein N2037_12750, partial [Acidimicrobiales bacterium]|nr:hypothetical protein [Acidimicrobiales bacterium]